MNKFLRKSALLLTLPLAFAATACDDDDGGPTAIEEDRNVVQVAQDAGSFNTLLSALDAAALTGALEGEGPFTVFAPTDDAFAAIDSEVLNDLLSDTELLAAVLTYHVVPGRFAASDVVGLDTAPTLNGKAVDISVDGGTVFVDGATVTATDIEASNGIIHVIDRVILPEPIADIVQVARGSATFNTLLAALEAADLTGALKGEGPFTVFAPTDDAFAAIDPEVLDDLLADTELLAAVLTYHVLPGLFPAENVVTLNEAPTLNGAHLPISVDGSSVMVDDANVIATDIEATNGIVHVIDKVILPEPIADIVQVARGAEIFSTLLAALEAADLTSALKGEGPFTVFAPTDDAFAAIDSEVLNDLLADTELLTAVLTYHVVPGLFEASDVVNLDSAPTLNGKDVAISAEGGAVTVDDANVITTDIEAKNGIVHVIDKVILPESIEDIVQVARGAEIFNTLLAALEAADLTSALKGEGPFTVFAPTDDAFAAIDSEVLNDLLADTELLTAVLTYHVVPGLFEASDVVNLDSAPTLNGKDVAISAEGGAVTVDDANVITTDIEAKNGIVHVIDQVILPESIEDIIQVAQGAGIFNTLLAAVEAAGLTEVLKGEGPFTVFAPTDEAFEAIPDEDLSALLADPEALAAVLTYHVVPGELLAADVLGSTSLTTVNGAEAPISLDGEGQPRIDDAIITATDIDAKNGVIHIIDRVIFPE